MEQRNALHDYLGVAYIKHNAEPYRLDGYGKLGVDQEIYTASLCSKMDMEPLEDQENNRLTCLISKLGKGYRLLLKPIMLLTDDEITHLFESRMYIVHEIKRRVDISELIVVKASVMGLNPEYFTELYSFSPYRSTNAPLEIRRALIHHGYDVSNLIHEEYAENIKDHYERDPYKSIL